MKKTNVFIALLTIMSIASCSLFQTGCIDENNRYVPKNPHFKLKNKKGHIIPKNLDTTNIYKLHYSYYRGLETYPKDAYKQNSDHCQLCKHNVYLKFYKNRECTSFYTPSKDKLGNPYLLKNDDLKQKYNSTQYYYSNKENALSIESFVPGEGSGIYITFDYNLNITGDTLINVFDKHATSIYVKEKIPTDWIKYPLK